MSRYQRLASPLRLGPVTVDNRIVFSAHLTNYASGGMPTEQHAAYYAARAAGGAGLIITEEHSVHPTDWPYEKLIHGFDPAVIAGYRAITEAVHAHGTPILAQINHNGGQASGMYSRLPVWAPSALPDPLFREVAKAVEVHEIDAIVAGYATVASHCRTGGFDGIELQCSHSSIVRQFLSGRTNHRDDEYGGDLPDRARLLLRIIEAVRSAIGPDLALGVRLCGDELVEGGTTIDEAVEVARLVEGHGGADYINTSIGVATETLYVIEASMHVPPGYAMFIPSAIRQAVDLPVVGVGRFKDPLQAERALEAGYCDLVGVVRGQIADPEFANKALSGNTEHVRLCLSCNQECVGRMGLNRWLGCIENPETGREALVIRRRPRPRGRHAMVVGAGPAGLQAAIALTRAGNTVTIHEREERAGGQVRLAASVPSRAEFGDLIRNQLHELGRLGVQVEVGKEIDRAAVEAADPDLVVVATGAVPSRPHWADASVVSPRYADAVEVLRNEASPSGSVLVVDDLGFHQSTSVAEVLADRGCDVEICTSALIVGQDLGVTLDQETWQMRAHDRGILQTTDVVVMAIREGVVELLHHPSGRTETRDVDWVVGSVPMRADDGLYHELLAAGWNVVRAGDCVAPRRAHAAVIEGDRAAVAS